MRAYRGGVKYRSSIPDKIKFPKRFEVDDQINQILQPFDVLADRHVDPEKGKQFWWPRKRAVLKIYVFKP